jgi:hypothetical protein
VRLIVAALLSVLLLSPVASVAGVAAPGGEVTRSEYRKVEKGMSRARVERIFGAGHGCVYLTYALDEKLSTGRQYRNEHGSTVAISFVTRADGVARVQSKLWGTGESCF